jgi:hypothetical protein
MNQEQADQGLVSFNEIQNQLAESFNPEKVQSQAKEVIANMLLMMAVPYFAGRLKNTLPSDVFEKLQTFLKGDVNLKNAMQFSRDLFEQKVLAPLKNQLVDGIKSYVPELKDIDLTKASLSDVQNYFTKTIINKMKSKLPQDIADRLPENFTQEDILNSVKTLTKNEALKFAKQSLPDDVYKQLEANKDIIDDPAQISDFIKGKINSVKGDITNTITRYKETAEAKFNEVKEQIKDKIDENVRPIKNKITELQQAKEDLQTEYQNNVDRIGEKLNDINQRARNFVSNNPEATDEQLQGFENERNLLRQQAESIDEDFQNGTLDIDSQIQTFKDNVDAITKGLVQKAQGIRSDLVDRLDDTREEAQTTLNQATEEGTTAFQKIKTFFTGDEETPSIFQRVRTYGRTIQERLTPANREQAPLTRQPQQRSGNIQDEILEADDDNPQFFAQAQARQIRMAGTQQPQEVLPRLQNRQAQLQQQQQQDQQLRQREAGQRELPEEEQRGLAPTEERVAAREGTELRTIRRTATRAGEEEGAIGVGDVVGGAIEAGGEGFGIYGLVESVRGGDRVGEITGGTQLGTSGATRTARALLPQEEAQARPQPPTTGDTQPAPTGEGQAPQPAQPPAQPAPETEGEGGLVEGGETTTTGTTTGSQATQATEQTVEKTAGIITGEETGEETGGLFAGLAIGEAIPIVDAIVSIGAIIGSIFGAKALMKGQTPKQPEISGESYEPNL